MMHASGTGRPLVDKIRAGKPGTTMDLRFMNALLVSEPLYLTLSNQGNPI